MDRWRTPKTRWWTPQRVGLSMIVMVCMWGMYLLTQTHIRYNWDIRESDYLKTEIIKLSKKYIHALSKENSKNEIGTSSNQQTAVLLNNMLYRIEYLEDQLHNVIVNSTNSFAHMDKVIKTLNNSLHRTWNMSEAPENNCEVPHDNGYPHCSTKFEWMKKNWKSNPKFAENGVNGSTCSFLVYLSQVEDYCPKIFTVSKQGLSKNGANSDEDTKCLAKSHDAAFPACKEKIDWMKKYWKSDPLYASHGVDGSICSFIRFLSEVETWCPLLLGRSHKKEQCEIPKVAAFPHCGDKVAWMRQFWNTDPCYRTFGVNGTICSFISYLGEVENWCPLFPGQKKWLKEIGSRETVKPNLSQTKLEDLLEILRNHDKIRIEWISQRIKRLWPNWIKGRERLVNRVDLGSYQQKKILIYIGLLADEANYHFAEQATKGGPLGELVQWSDLIVALYLLGHDITLSLSRTGKYGMEKILKTSISGLCPNKKQAQYDVIYTDYIGLSHMIRKFKNVNSIKCHLRVVDSFGTEAQFNHKIEKNIKNLYGIHNLNLKQYYTMFPHSPDNTFLGFIVENHGFDDGVKIKKKPIALVYGKHISMWEDHQKIAFLDVIRQHFEVHATVGGRKNDSKVPYMLPRYVVNHGVLAGEAYQQLLRETTLFVGLGFPYEGPAPLEAIANGCFFLNAKLDPPLGRSNEKFFKQKPTERKLTSQHPYAEVFIGKPYVYTVKLNDKDALEKALNEMDDSEISPYLPFEFTYEGMLERLYALTKHHNFCDGDHGGNMMWPPKSAKVVFTGEPNEGCDQVCSRKGYICEPAFFPAINDKNSFPKSCVATQKASMVAPAVMVTETVDAECMLQATSYFYSCTARSPSAKRICPCRDFMKGQTALCRDCLDGLR